ncbi:glutamate--cysteine ligase [Amphibacillus sp. Q70]|uniref:glutamate--cysteine ligase n=1 Tax=Amphibacillus sp. Q70 TaxID=3453416 RepID=UPI003F8544E7
MLTFFKENHKSHRLLSGQWGIERETHRINHDGSIALTPHPKEFIEKQTNHQITVDFAENQLEFVTKTGSNLDQVFNELEQIYQRVNQSINGELMWPFSMPPRLPAEESIPIASFPHLQDGQKKEIYRRGLAVRYGKKLQMISGIHYNYSFDDQLLNLLYKRFSSNQSKQAFNNELYLKIGRNMLKYRWLLIYLFGASPIADSSYQSVFEDKIESNKSEWLTQCFDQMNLSKHATSIRSSRFGYSTEVEDKYQVSYNHLDQYIADLRNIILTENKRYAAIGTEKNGEKIQLNTKELQHEGEFYAPIRFRQIARSDETLLDALEQRGIQYFELRLIDVNPFAKLGLTKEQAEFIHLFILMCLFEENDGLSKQEQILANKNHQMVALFGRQPGLKLYQADGEEVLLKTWARDIFKKVSTIAELLDQATNKTYYQDIVKAEARKLDDMSLLLSEQIVTEMKRHDESFLDFGLRLARHYQLSQSHICKNA